MQVGRAVAVAALLGSLGTACGAAHSAHVDPASRARYLSRLHSSAPEVGQFRTDDQLVRLGVAACDGLAAKAPLQQVADLIERTNASHPLPPEDIGAMISAAVAGLCPEYTGRLQPVGP